VRARPSPVARKGDRVLFVPRAAPHVLGPTAGSFRLAATPGRRSSLCDFGRHPAGGCVPVCRRSPKRAIELSWCHVLSPSCWAQPCPPLLLAIWWGTEARHPAGGCRADHRRSPDRAVVLWSCAACCVPFAGANHWLIRVAATPGGRSSLCFFARHPTGACVPARRRSPRRACFAVVVLRAVPAFSGQPLIVGRGHHSD